MESLYDQTIEVTIETEDGFMMKISQLVGCSKLDDNSNLMDSIKELTLRWCCQRKKRFLKHEDFVKEHKDNKRSSSEFGYIEGSSK
jgi:hypothetical protein